MPPEWQLRQSFSKLQYSCKYYFTDSRWSKCPVRWLPCFTWNMASGGAPGAMDSLRARGSKPGRRKKANGAASRVQQFYDEFNSSSSSRDSSSDEGQKGTFFGYKNRPRAPMIRPTSASAGHPTSVEIPPEINSTPSDASSVASPKFHFPDPPTSPGLTANQDIKDSALNVIYQKRIRELKSIQWDCSEFLTLYLANSRSLLPVATLLRLLSSRRIFLLGQISLVDFGAQ